VCGLETEMATYKSHAHQCVMIANEIMLIIQKKGFVPRAGIHTGPISCAIIGDLKFAYDIYVRRPLLNITKYWISQYQCHTHYRAIQ
jgi:hypothetical protein